LRKVFLHWSTILSRRTPIFFSSTDTTCCAMYTLYRHSLRENFPHWKPALHPCIIRSNGYYQLHDIPTNVNNAAGYTNIFQPVSVGAVLYRAHISFQHWFYSSLYRMHLFVLYRGADKSLARRGRNKLQRQKILSFIYLIYNHNWRNISTIYTYNKTSIKRNVLSIKLNKLGSRSG
jgi:hypothetical protein